MVRFIIFLNRSMIIVIILIYIPIWLDLLWIYNIYNQEKNRIYIPIWLDLLLSTTLPSAFSVHNLHSNMVRFIIILFNFYKLIIISIYIPIWLDLLYIISGSYYDFKKDLHSNMVRFIIDKQFEFIIIHFYLHSNMVRFIINEET